MDGSGSVVETLAQSWTLVDREVQHEFADSHQRTITLLGWTCGQNGLFRDLCTSLDMSVVEMAPTQLERNRGREVGRTRSQNGSKSIDGKILCQQRYPKSVGMLMGLQNMHNNRQDGYNLLRIVGSGVSLLEQSFGGKRRRVMASNGDEWRQLVDSNGDGWRQLWLRMASNGVDGWRHESTDIASSSGVRHGVLWQFSMQ